MNHSFLTSSGMEKVKPVELSELNNIFSGDYISENPYDAYFWWDIDWPDIIQTSDFPYLNNLNEITITPEFFQNTEQYPEWSETESILMSGASLPEMAEDIQKSVASWVNASVFSAHDVQLSPTGDIIRQMYEGCETDGGKTLGLKEIGRMKVHPDYIDQNLKQQSGWSAEVISTAKDNIKARLEGSDIITYRADDRPDLFPRNDPYVDKIRIDGDGNIVERIQSKFIAIGKSPEECLKKLQSGKYDKYLNDGKVDTLEVSPEKYDGLKQLIPKELEKLQVQLERARANGNIETAQKIQAKIDRLEKLDKMLGKSSCSEAEAMNARVNPERYMVKSCAGEILSSAHRAGMRTGITSAEIGAAISAVDNISKVVHHEISVGEALGDIAKDTGETGAIGYVSGALTEVAAQAASASGNKLLQSAANVGVPGAIVSVAVASLDSIVDYQKGNITGKELTYDLGKNTIGVVGNMAGSALAGAAAGTVVPGVGNVVGFGIGLVGGMLGYIATTTLYKSVLENGEENESLKKQAESIKTETISMVKENEREKADVIQSAFEKYDQENHLNIACPI